MYASSFWNLPSLYNSLKIVWNGNKTPIIINYSIYIKKHLLLKNLCFGKNYEQFNAFSPKCFLTIEYTADFTFMGILLIDMC